MLAPKNHRAISVAQRVIAGNLPRDVNAIVKWGQDEIRLWHSRPIGWPLPCLPNPQIVPPERQVKLQWPADESIVLSSESAFLTRCSGITFRPHDTIRHCEVAAYIKPPSVDPRAAGVGTTVRGVVN